jgi:4-amino-4-deoxy-L-arabinose transferase-like glycosyltransferase
MEFEPNKEARWGSFLRGWSPALIIFYGLLILVPGSYNLPLIDRDEPRFAQAAREMLEEQEWLIPRFNGVERFDKPPMIYWLVVLAYKLGGITEWTARLPSILSATGVALILWGWGNSMLSSRSALLAPLAWLSSLQVYIHGRLCLADMLMVFALTLTMWCLWHLWKSDLTITRRQRMLWGGLLSLALSMGFLAKGPVAWIVPLLTLVLAGTLFRLSFSRHLWGTTLSAFLCALFLVGLWGIPALIESGGRYFHVGVGEHVVQRGLGAMNGRSFNLGYYLWTAPLSLWPWCLLVPFLGFWDRKFWSEECRFLLAWLLIPYLIFSFYATQLPHYILPGLPAFFLILGLRLDGEYSKISGLRYLAVGLVVLFLLVALYFAYGWSKWPAAPALVYVGLILASLTGQLFWVGSLTWRITALVLAVGLAFFFHQAADQLRKYSPAVQLAAWASPGKAIGFEEPSLVFYTGKGWTFGQQTAPFSGSEPKLELRLKRELGLKSFFINESENYFDAKNSSLKSDKSTMTKHNLEGINFARAKWVELEVVLLPGEIVRPGQKPNQSPSQ